MSGDLVELTIRDIALGGSGVGNDAGGRVVFVPRTVPGDRVRVELTEQRARWAKARVVELRQGGPARVEPPCPNFSSCGGCQWQHVSPEEQAGALTRGISEVLRRVGGMDVPVIPLEPSPLRSGYRNRVTFTLRRQDGTIVAGYHRPSGPGVVDIDCCPLAEPAIERAWKGLRNAWGPSARLLPRGADLRLTLRASAAGNVGLLVGGGSMGGSATERADPSEVESARRHAAALLKSAPALSSIWWKPRRGGRHHVGGTRYLSETWDGLRLDLRPEAFLQTNRSVAATIERYLDDEIGDPGGMTIADLYAGVGARSIRWAARGARVVAVEAGGDAVETGRDAGRRAGVAVRFVQATVERSLADLGAPDLIVVNPPRTGLSAEAASALATTDAARIAYISCDPSTLARDMARLASAWRPRVARPFDVFPQTGHVETVLWLDRRASTDL